jgi:CheY-like chemotaxis protein
MRLLMLTSVDGAGEERLAREAGIDGYVTKPVRQSVLELQLARVFGLRLVATAKRPQKIGASRPARVLLAEDNALNRTVAIAVLQKASHTVQIAENGVEAVKALRDGTFDMILMDCQMPEMDGFAATAAIRELESSDPRRGHVPIIALTANAMEGDRERCLAAKFDDYLAKPFKQQDLLAMVERWTAQPVAA